MRGEALCKNLADSESMRTLGQIVARMCEIAGWSKGQLARELGYGDDQSQVARWVNGADRAHMEKLIAIRVLRPALILALAERESALVEVEHVVRVRRAVGQ